MASNITVAILNWNGIHHLKQYLPSVVAHSGDARIRVIDNASNDDSVSWLKNEYPDVELHILPKNLGFTGGYNEALRHIETELVVLLNSDVEVTANWLYSMEKRMASDSKIAACQPKILSWRQKDLFEYAGACGGFLDVMGYPFCRGRIFETCETDSGQYDTAIPVFWASGACMMVRKDAFLKCGGFEETFFAHMEEIDLCWRFWKQGYSVWVEPQSTVYHLGAGTLSKTSPKKTFLNYRNGLAMLFMNSTSTQLFWKIPLRLVLDGIAGFKYIYHGEWKNCWAIAKAHMAFYGQFGYWMKRRKDDARTTRQTIPSSVFLRISVLPAYFLEGRKRFSQMMIS